jgi:hypothetical protein
VVDINVSAAVVDFTPWIKLDTSSITEDWAAPSDWISPATLLATLANEEMVGSAVRSDSRLEASLRTEPKEDEGSVASIGVLDSSLPITLVAWPITEDIVGTAVILDPKFEKMLLASEPISERVSVGCIVKLDCTSPTTLVT